MSSFAATKIITILVGPEKVEYFLHKDILIQYSPFFAKCLATNMKEALSNVVEMPEILTAQLTWLAMYLYKNALPEQDINKAPYDVYEAWALADRLCMPRFQDMLMDRLMDYSRRKVIPMPYFAWVIEHHNHLDTLSFRFVRDQVLYEWPSGNDALYEKENMVAGLNDLLVKGFLDNRFVLDLLVAAKTPTPDPCKQGCKHHVHGTSKACTVRS
ncbi:uncharacterized protein A1O9_10125 [Exophiala aquamarina CBS 119918]|uniref:BTB domain-containing protein n=1 Tax=Exophiala aquamarina CBS 119918 TaxID=1182545 RepID=A0A072P0R1_9EURO|nr:uncharacterized protein A1O9_10125 [Exophiala aquamarina CBS 119918]KEF53724.1 hypothetical protein A1O9_10125 [Exophiala aquamarina CBS 119918]